MNHAQAREIILRAWQRVHGRAPSPSEAEIAQAIASLETGYGRAGQFAAMAARGQFNWGALERRADADGNCPDGFAKGTDQGKVCFYVFPSDEEAAVAFLKNLTAARSSAAFSQRTDGVLAAMATGSSEAVARAMRTPSSVAYYAGNPGTEEQKVAFYSTAIQSHRDAIRRELGSPAPPPGPSPFPVVIPDRSSLLPLALAALAVGGLYYLGVRERIVPPPTRLLRVARRMA